MYTSRGLSFFSYPKFGLGRRGVSLVLVFPNPGYENESVPRPDLKRRSVLRSSAILRWNDSAHCYQRLGTLLPGLSSTEYQSFRALYARSLPMHTVFPSQTAPRGRTGISVYTRQVPVTSRGTLGVPRSSSKLFAY